MAKRSYLEVITKGDYLTSLEATRDRIAADLESCESMRDKAALYLRLQNVLERIEEARPPVEKKGDVVDEIAKRRAARRAGASAG